MKTRPILIAGFGSIGRRHLRNLERLGYKNVILYRTGKSTLPDDEIADIPQFFDLHKALARKPLATIIANPTAFHMPLALAAARAGSHLFIEKPISHTIAGVKKLQTIAHAKKLVVQVGFHFRFHPGLQKVKKQIARGAIGQVVSVQANWGQYLPDWHPWEEYRNSYAAKKNLGGGVLLTLCHPFDYLRWLFGDVATVAAQTSRRGGLAIDVEDTADVLLRFISGVTATVHLDYVQKPSEHTLRIIGRSGILRWDAGEGLERNTIYEHEMRHFLACISRKEQPLCTLDDGVKNLQIVLAAKDSARKKMTIVIPAKAGIQSKKTGSPGQARG